MSNTTVAEVMDMFQNGEQRYDTSAYFKEAINALAAGVGVHAVLDRVLKEHVILMHLHNEELNRNRVAVAEVGRLMQDNVTLIDEVASYKDALQHYQK